jgi:predicted transcriptional regulator
LYAAAQLGSQFHTCVYSILIVEEQAQLIRWDRTGAVVSEPIFYNEDDALMEFFC